MPVSRTDNGSCEETGGADTHSGMSDAVRDLGFHSGLSGPMRQKKEKKG
jgi:hypothetical protein